MIPTIVSSGILSAICLTLSTGSVNTHSPTAVYLDANGVETLVAIDESEGAESSQAYVPTGSEIAVEPTLIFGNDDRQVLTDSQYTLFPYRAVCMLETEFDANGDGVTDYRGMATGFLVGPKTVMTAAHVTYNSSRGGWATAIHIMPAAHRNAQGTMVKPYGTLHGYAMLRGRYPETGNPADDWALLDLYDNIGNTLGYFGLSSTLSNNANVRLYGYHGDLNGKLAYGNGTTTGVETYRFKHNCDAIAGSSGGAITSGNTTTVVGMHSGGYNNDWDFACRISPYIIGYVEERMD